MGHWLDDDTLVFGSHADTVLKRTRAGVVDVTAHPATTGVQKRDWYVGASGDYATIQAAVNAASDGDVIHVDQGTYAENLVLTGKNDLSIVVSTPVGRAITYNARPNITPATGIALTLAQCRRCYFYGLYFYSTNNVAVLSDSEGCTFENCESSSDTAEEYKLLCATDKDFTGSGTTWKGCILDSGVNGIKSYVRTAAGAEGQATNCVVLDCDFYGHSAADIADEGAGAGTQPVFDSWRITGNRFLTRNKSVYLAMNTAARGDASTNVLISDNDFADDGGLDATKIKFPAGAVFAGNRDATGVVDGSGF